MPSGGALRGCRLLRRPDLRQWQKEKKWKCVQKQRMEQNFHENNGGNKLKKTHGHGVMTRGLGKVEGVKIEEARQKTAGGEKKPEAPRAPHARKATAAGATHQKGKTPV